MTVANRRTDSVRKTRVLAIGLLAILSGACRPLSHTAEMQTADDLRTVRIALALYKQENGRYPSETDGLSVLTGQYLSDFAIEDAWHREFVYKRPDGPGDSPESFVVYSIGANGLDESGGGDDISAAVTR